VRWRLRGLYALVVLSLGVMACGGGEDLGGDRLDTNPVLLQAASAEAMGSVTSVRFDLIRTGAPVFIDQIDSISLDKLEGRFQSPGSADAILQVTVNESLGTKLGAVAIADEVWLSNPVTGKFETLPAGFDLDPSLFFDPKDGWQPLLEGLTNVTFIGEQDRDGARYHLTATALSNNMEAITAGLVRGQNVDLDLWIHPVTADVRAIEFSTELDGAVTDWVLELRDFGEEFSIEPPEQ